MCRFVRGVFVAAALVALGAAACCATLRSASAESVRLKDDRILHGKPGMVDGLTEQPRAPDPDGVGPLQRIAFLDDDLRRTFFSKRLRQQVLPDDPAQVEERFSIRQRVARGGRRVSSVGPIVRITPFDEFGRRIFSFKTTDRQIDVVQGITAITPTWTRVDSLKYLWGDRGMRIATSSIPRDVLHKILRRQIDPKNKEHRKKIARFYLQSELYKQAREELEAIVKDFPDQPNLRQELEPTIRAVRQLGADVLLRELKLRREAGQHRMVFDGLKNFPSEGIASEKLMEVRELVQEYERLLAQGKETIEQIEAELAKVQHTETRAKIKPICDEIRAELNVNTQGRLTAFRQHVDDPDLLPQEKLALAISGWLLGSDASVENLAVGLSLYRVRGLVKKYLNEPVKISRSQVLRDLESEDAAAAGLVAGLLAHMKPPWDPPEPVASDRPGYYKLQVVGLSKEPPVAYLVQVPPEYDPYRRYPMIVTLHGAGMTPAQQVDWWAGGWDQKGRRLGQATRHGYIVVAPQWTTEHQKKYRYSAREHAAVLNCLRDACRRFAADTDRVYLSGHSIGGDAAWDIGLAHPDLWAGVIPIVAQADRYCARYWENARYVPFYVVCGELDGRKLVNNSRDLDRYLHRGYNCTVVEYLGRGHEHFYDEILRIFDWMGRYRRDFFPREFTCSTMRPWDDYFWWIELEGFPARSVVDPEDWPPPRGTQPVRVKGNILATNGVNVRTAAGRVTVWLTPEIVNFERRANILVNGKHINSREPFVQPDLQTLLEDVRTRGDRQHPFWVKVEAPTGRGR